MGAVLTNLGISKLASATPENQVEIVDFAAGDGNGSVPTVSPTQTALVNEVWRGTAGNPVRDPNDNRVLIFESRIPPEDGGFWVREIGIFDSDGDLIAVADTSEFEKPDPNAGDQGIDLILRMYVALDNADTVSLVYDNTGGTLDHGGLGNREAFDAHPRHVAKLLTIAEVRATPGVEDSQTIVMIGRDGNPFMFLEWDADNTSADDGSTVFAVSGVTTGRWVKVIADDQYLQKSSNLNDLPNKGTARTNLDVYAKAEVYSKAEADARYYNQAASDGRYLNESNNLSDLNNTATARTNLDVYSKGEADARYLLGSNNLSDLTSAATARTNLDVYSKGESDLRYLNESSNLSDLNDVATARANLDAVGKTADKASQAEAEAGTNDAKYMTPLKTKQSVDVHSNAIIADMVIGYCPIQNIRLNDTSVDLSATIGTANCNCFVVSDDGLKAFALDDNVHRLVEFEMSTAHDLNTLAETGVTFSVSAQMPSFSTRFSVTNNGTRLYILDALNDTIFQYNLSSWDLSTITYSGKSKSVSAQSTSVNDCQVLKDGTKLVVIGGGTLYQYTLSTPYEINTATYDSISYTDAGWSNVRSFEISPDYRQITLYGIGGIYQSSISGSIPSVADVEAISSVYDANYNRDGILGGLFQSVRFADLGRYLYIWDRTVNAVRQYKSGIVIN